MQYSYFCECGERKELTLPSVRHKYRPRCVVCRKKMQRDFVVEHSGTVHRPGNWPMEQSALAVRSYQVEEAKKFYESRGVKVEFSKSGAPIALSPAHNKEIVAARGCVDYSGGYCSAQPGDSKKYERG